MICFYEEGDFTININSGACYTYEFNQGQLLMQHFEIYNDGEGQCEQFILESGCLDIQNDVCNFYELGSCIYSEENYNCEGECVAQIDCNGNCGGSASIDNCGICSGGSTGLEFDGFLGCDDICFSGLEFDECGVCGGQGGSCNVGDINGDGQINVVDIVNLVNWIFDELPYNSVADLNSDGTINVVDIVTLVNSILSRD
tara:strand:- start:92 stop:691 length:600 start_codon:yes stop_codon:yes gene_type:complete